ncbi:penicillin-insensitive murein endopeptidase [Falsihalocynthiibacter sp. S25ZX9]|uniref:penicillin-insensitive murein endopeptidase n=1 Tax=Falsihalocynthiibacter sp. S25ZX9 TaxID=3240870 RepID=UPI00350EA5FB
MKLRGILTVILALASAPSMAAEPEARSLFGAKKTGTNHQSMSFGGYSKGCIAGAQQLPETGPTWQAMRLSRNRNWAHSDTIEFIERLSKTAAQQSGWNGLYVGDMSQPRGGPMTSGHRSHQLGLDADIWMLPATNLNLSRKDRENLSSISMQKSKGAYVNSGWTAAHHNILKAAAKDKSVARIFVFPGAKVQMCRDEKGNRDWLRKIRPWYGHHYHFHVRLACPKGEKNCVDQAPPPKGDGCADAEKWVADILNPPAPKPRDPNAPPPKKRRELILSDLPNQCAQVLSSQ